MVNTALLKNQIKTNGIKQKYIAEKMGISVQSLTRKLNNSSEFKINEVQTLSNILHMSTDDQIRIFFGSKVE